MERLFEIRPAWDKRNKDPKKNYGVHGAELFMGVKGKHGAVQFVVFLNWHLPAVEIGKKDFRYESRIDDHVLPADVGFHSKTPMYEGQEPMSDSCQYTDNEPCYYDGSGLHASKVFDMLVAEGSDAVYKYLGSLYKQQFGELK